MQIDYEIVRSNRSSIGITIERDGSIVVNAPQELDKDEIENTFIKSDYGYGKN
ncbi:MAG: hypothetical protein J0647_07500 [Campylobacteraceae bacterium]|nr:hypothetical protein [Campylobacteraceae bacterium]